MADFSVKQQRHLSQCEAAAGQFVSLYETITLLEFEASVTPTLDSKATMSDDTKHIDQKTYNGFWAAWETIKAAMTDEVKAQLLAMRSR